MNDFVIGVRRHGQEFVPADCYGLWCSLEDLSALCGYDPVKQFDLLRELPSVYPVVSGRDPYEIAEEHPMQALACVVSAVSALSTCDCVAVRFSITRRASARLPLSVLCA